jgi:hypothetical protein
VGLQRRPRRTRLRQRCRQRDRRPWLVLGLSASPGSIFTGQQSTLTADLTKYSIGTDTSGSGHIQDGTSVLFATDLGSVGSPSVVKPMAGGKATATLHANGGPGTANISVALDNQTVNGQVIVTLAPTPSPTPTATHTPTPSPIHTVSPTPSALLQGDVNCDGAVNAVDALDILRVAAALLQLPSRPGCPAVGSHVHAGLFGDLNCNGSVDAVDALADLRFVAQLSPLTQHPPCTPVGSLLG